MSSVALNSRATSLEQLQTINRMAQSTKGTATGRIGLLDGHVIKFNTHWQERLFGSSASPEMIRSCDNLRSTICDLIDKTLVGRDSDLAQSLKAKILAGENKSLLDRSVVASVIQDVENSVNADAARYESSWLSSSTGKSTSFKNVKREVSDNRESGEVAPRTAAQKLEDAKGGLVSEIRQISNNTHNKVLTVGTRKFLDELIDLNKKGPKVYRVEVDARFEAFKAEVGKIYRESNRGMTDKMASGRLNRVFDLIENLIKSTKVDESEVAAEEEKVESDEMATWALSCGDSLPGRTDAEKIASFKEVVSRLKEDGKEFDLDEVVKSINDAAMMLDELKNDEANDLKDSAFCVFRAMRSDAEQRLDEQLRGAGDVSPIEEAIVHLGNVESVVNLFLEKADTVG